MRKKLPSKYSFDSNGEFWQAAKTHDFKYDGKFLYSKTTNVCFCHPSCKSRKSIENKSEYTYFLSANEAKELGYRPCKRCNSDDPGHISPENRIQLLIPTIEEYLKRTGKTPRLQDLGNLLTSERSSKPLSLSHLQRTTRVNGRSPFKISKEVTKNRGTGGKRVGKKDLKSIKSNGTPTVRRFFRIMLLLTISRNKKKSIFGMNLAFSQAQKVAFSRIYQTSHLITLT